MSAPGQQGDAPVLPDCGEDLPGFGRLDPVTAGDDAAVVRRCLAPVGVTGPRSNVLRHLKGRKRDAGMANAGDGQEARQGQTNGIF
jgi:hypothetical protein